MKNKSQSKKGRFNPHDFIQWYIQQAKKFKLAELPKEFSDMQAGFEIQRLLLGERSHLIPQIEEIKFKKEQEKKQAEKIRSEYDEYVKAQKHALSDEAYVKIDELKAKESLLKGKSQILELVKSKFIANEDE